ncbi:MAG TPA: ABC transporter permease [Gemmatimonadaceae bacterium]|jgi:predicted permease
MSEPLLPPRIRQLFRLPADTAARVANDVDEELAFHLEMRAKELEAAGLSPIEAAAEARRQFGDTADVERHALDVFAPVQRRARTRDIALGWLHDLRIATRQFRRAPLFSAIAVMTLALGIGANTAMFSVIHHLLLAPLPYVDGGRMTELRMATGMLNMQPDGATFGAWRARARSFDDITFANGSQHVLDDGAEESRVSAAEIAANYFSFLGVHPAIGRAFTADDGRVGAAPVAIIGYSLWRQRYAGSKDAVGQRIRVDSVTRTIVGVASPRLGVPFDDGSDPVVWMPATESAADTYFTIGKLRNGVSTAVAAAELASISATVDHSAYKGPKMTEARVLRPQDLLGDKYQRALLLLFGAVSAVLMIACANVAHLLLARAWGRQREFAIRGALGAGRARLARLMLCESVVLAVAGGIVGLLVAKGALALIVAYRPIQYEGLDHVRLEPAVLGWTLGISLLSAILFGFGPALFAGGRRASDLLKSGTRVSGLSGGARRARGGMIVVEVALSVALLVVAGLLVRSYDALLHVPLGFDPQNLSALRVSVPASVPAPARSALLADMLAGVRRIPGINDATFGGVPLETGMLMGDIEPEGGRPANVSPIRLTGLYAVQAGYFKLVGIPLRGSTFGGDTTGRTPGPTSELVISESLARRLWPNGDAVGSRMRLNPRSDWMTVVGVAADLSYPGRTGEPYDFQVYEPALTRFTTTEIVFRQRVPLEALVPAIRKTVGAVYPGATIVGDVRTADGDLREILAAPRFAMTLLGVFALIALSLSAIGLYGVISYAVGQRTHEIGVRVALGARPRDVRRLVARESGTLVGIGLLVGLCAAVAASRATQSYLFGVAPFDVVTYTAVSVLLGAVALLACYAPVRRALRVDPIVALAAD